VRGVKLKVKKQEFEAVRIEEGIYEAKFKGIEQREVETEQGKREVFVWTFEVDTGEETVEIQGMTSTKISTGRNPSKAYNWLSAIMGRKLEPDEEIDTDELVGKECVVIVEDKKVGDLTVSRVTDVKKARPRKTKKSKKASADDEEVEV